MAEWTSVIESIDQIVTDVIPRDISTVVGFLGLRCVVRTNTSTVPVELLDRLLPFADVRAGSSRARVDASAAGVVEIDAFVTDSMPPRPRSRARRMQARPVASAKPQYFDCFEAGKVLAVSAQSDTMIVGSAGEPVAVVGSDPSDVAIECRRLVQDLIHIHASRSSMLNLESAAVSVDAGGQWRGLLIMGESGAGKSTLLTRLAGLMPTRYAANDELFVVPTENGVIAHGSPVNVKVKRSSALAGSELFGTSGKADPGNGKYAITYREFCAALGIDLQASVEVTALLIPHADEMEIDATPAGVRQLVLHLERWTNDWPSPWAQLMPKKPDAGQKRDMSGLLEIPVKAVPWSISDSDLVRIVESLDG